MKKWLSLLIFLPAFLAAQSDLSKTLPFDPSIRTGELPNGMKYFIRQNAKPEKRAELRLALNAGAMQEDDDQQGLAHFCEHLCFNGTKNFPKSALVDYLESVGTRFGPHLNAYTSFDETVYMLQIPTDNREQFEKGFQVLEEWAHNVSFDGEEIDKERGVVVSERRNGLGAERRMFDKVFPVMFQGSRYAERLPIGKLEVLETFPHDRVRQFYQDWYRPELMAVIAIGDFNVDDVEKLIKTRFGALPKSPANVRQRVNYEVPDHEEQLIAIATDKEASRISMGLMFKHPAGVDKTYSDYRNSLIRYLCNTMINNRLNEIRQQADPPFSFGYAYYGSQVRMKNAFAFNFTVTEKNIWRGMETMFTECERLHRHGFAASELERAKKQMMKNVESQYNERDKTESAMYTYGLVDHFLEGSPMTSIEFDFDFYKKYLDGVTLDEVNRQVQSWITDGRNSVISYQGIVKDGVAVPAQDEIRKLVAKIKAADIPPYEDKVVDKPLMASIPAAGKIVAEKQIPETGVTELTFANGLRVALKPTDFQNDEILFNAYSMGGSSLLPEEDDANADFAASIIRQSGVADFSPTELNKYLAGRQINLSFFISEISEGIGFGSCTKDDLETALQMIHLYFTNPRKDPEAFQAFVQQQKAFLENKGNRPEMVFMDSVNYILSNYHPRRKPTTVQILDGLSLDRIHEIFRKRFANAGDFTFTFTGSFEMNQMKKLTATYLGSLPGQPAKEQFVDLGIQPPKGTLAKSISKGSEPKSTVQLVFNGKANYSLKDDLEMDALIALLRIKLREAIREDKGGTYGVSVYGGVFQFPKPGYRLTVSFNCDPGRVEELTQTALEVLEKVKQEGAAEADIVKVKETDRRTLETEFKENRFWSGTLNQVYYNGLSMSDFASMETLHDHTNHMTSGDFKRLANSYVDMNNMLKFTMLPEPQTGKP